jgi:hypothetical protein
MTICDKFTSVQYFIVHYQVKVSITQVQYSTLQNSQCVIFVSLWVFHWQPHPSDAPGNAKGGSIIVQLTSCLTGLELAV